MKSVSNLFVLGSACIFLFFSCKTKKELTYSFNEMDTVRIQPEAKMEYRASRKRTTDIIHTKLELSFNWDSAWALGVAEITLKPYFYDLDTIELDARGFEIADIWKVEGEDKMSVEFIYENNVIQIPLISSLTRNDTVKYGIRYTAKPNELVSQGSSAISDDRGLYFINHDNSEKGKPRQLWTQGETEANSCWFPTVDSPNEKMTTDIYLTFEEEFTSISNGMKMFSVSNSDGTKTEYWKMDQPHAVYLVMMAIGPFAEYKDQWKDMEVNYYLDSAYLKYAKNIFGNTPEMMTFYSDYLGTPYPWPKYDQVVVHDYVSGAMENTTATIHGDFLQQTDRERIDYDNEDVIAHELFHHWFGDLITCESWSNLTINEGFATYGEFLWQEYKYGKDEADWQITQDLKSYMMEAEGSQKDLIRFNYNDKEEMFDAHSYSKGGRVIHMLRQVVGEDAFRESLKLFLSRYAYKNAEIHDLRLVFEEVTGEDLNWFFNQWFLASGHPILDLSWNYNEIEKTVEIVSSQEQTREETPTYRIPLPIEIHTGEKIILKELNIENRKDTFKYKVSSKPDYINFDPRNVLLAEVNIEQTKDQWTAQYNGSERYADRREAMDNLMDTVEFSSHQLFVKALDDDFWANRGAALNYMEVYLNSHDDIEIKVKLQNMLNDEESMVRSKALFVLEKSSDENIIPMLTESLKDSSYQMVTVAIMALAERDSVMAKEHAKVLENETNNNITITISELYTRFGDPDDYQFFEKTSQRDLGWGAYSFLLNYGEYLSKQDDELLVKSLPYFEEVSIENTTWWIRMSAIQSVMLNHGRIMAELIETTNELNALPEGDPKYSELNAKLTAKTETFEAVNDVWGKITKNESFPRLVTMISNYNDSLSEAISED